MKQLKEIYIKYKLIIWPVSSGIASLIILFFVIIPQVSGYLSTRGQISDVYSRSDILEVKAKDLEGINDELTKQDLQVAFSVLPTDRDVPQTMAILQDIINRSGLVLKDTSYNATSNTGNAKGASKNSFQLNLTLLGQIGSVKNFLINLQQSGRIFQVESISVQFQKSSSLVEAQIPVTVFYELAPKNVSSKDEKAPKLSDKERQLLAELSKSIAQLGGGTDDTGAISSVPLGKSDPFQ